MTLDLFINKQSRDVPLQRHVQGRVAVHTPRQQCRMSWRHRLQWARSTSRQSRQTDVQSASARETVHRTSTRTSGTSCYHTHTVRARTSTTTSAATSCYHTHTVHADCIQYMQTVSVTSQKCLVWIRTITGSSTMYQIQMWNTLFSKMCQLWHAVVLTSMN